jgi:putative ABC transport system permease protein
VFVRSLDSFTRTPARYGLGFDLSLELPATGFRPVLAQLADDRDLAAVARSTNDVVEIGGRSADAYAIDAVKGTISPTVRSGRLPANDNEVAIGPKLLADLGRHIGDELRVDSRSGDRAMTLVGTVFSPASESSEFNGEVVMTPDALASLSRFPSVGALVRVRDGVGVARVFDDLDARFPYAVSDESRVHAPGPVRNLQQISRLPLALVVFFAFFGVAAIAQSLFLTARERRRDLAVLRGLGFRRRQVVVVLLGAACSVAAVALVVGIPLGVLAGRIGWTAVARGLYVAPAVAIPVATLAGFGAAVVAASCLASLLPAALLLRRSPGSTLRSE